jgi:hypothetical protein
MYVAKSHFAQSGPVGSNSLGGELLLLQEKQTYVCSNAFFKLLHELQINVGILV